MSRPTPEDQRSTLHCNAWSESGGFSATNYTNIISHREHNSRSTPGYAALKRLKLLPDNGYQSMGYKMSTDLCWGASINRIDGRTLSWSTFPVWNVMGALPLALQPSDMMQDARNRAYQRMAKQASAVQVNVAQFFGERKQCADMISKTAQRISRAALALKRADFRAFTQALDLSGTVSRRAALNWRAVESTPFHSRISSFWLEYVYGWRPLLSDITSAAEMLAKKVVDPTTNFGSLKSSATVTRNVTSLSDRGGSTHYCYDRYSSHSIKIKSFAQYELENEVSSVLAQTGITNPLLLAWELLPYSFVVDWFLPVGNYLESLTAFDGFKLSHGYVSTLERSGMTGSVSLYSDGNVSYPLDVLTGGGCSATQYRYTLVPGAALSYSPQLKSPIGGRPLERFATASALISNLFRK